MEPTQLDQDALNLTKAIRQHESGGDFNSKGESGETGAYQFTAPTWKGYAKEVLGDENAQMTPENQNKVAYTKIKKWKDAGHNVGEIASMWNAGEGRPKAYLENNVGTNSYGVRYDTPAYAKAVAENYQKLKSQTVQPTKPQTGLTPLETPKPEEPTLGQELGKRGEEVATGISSLAGGKDMTGQTRVSGLIQTAGGIAGGLGDVVNKIIEKTPIVGSVVKGLESIIGSGAKAFFNTEVGQSVAKHIADFSENHPELSKDIGAGINIATAIPILKGLGVVKNIALDATSSALKGVAEKAMTRDLTEAAARTIGGKNLIAKNPEAVSTLIQERAIPEIVNGRFSTKEARIKIGQKISSIEDNELQPALQKATSQGISTSYSPLADVEKRAIAQAESDLVSTGPIKEYFAKIRTKYGEYPNISQLNEAKRKVATNITKAGFASPTITTDKIVRSSLQTAVEDGAKALGLPDVAEINAKMANLFKVQDLLKVIENKPIKTGMVSDIVKNTATVGGEALGNMTGLPFAGALVGRGIGGNVGSKLTGGIPGILKRTGQGAERVTKEELKKKLGGLFGGAVSQKMSGQ